MAAAGTLALAADATLLEAPRPQLVRVEVPLARLPASLDGLAIAQLSDFHYDDTFTLIPIRRAVEIVSGLQPHLIALTGDFVTVPVTNLFDHDARHAASAAEPCARLLSRLQAPLGMFAILGNHDTGSDVPRIVDALQTSGIVVLQNRSVPLEWQGSRLWLAGLNDVLEGKPDIHATLRGIPGEEPVVLLAHEPDFADHAARFPVDLQLSGHSHGGQIRFPLIGAPYLPELARKYPWGLRRIGPLTLYTNVGLGTIRIPARLNCPPEVTLFTLRSGTRIA